MAPKTSEYLARVREKTGLSDYAISKKYSINQSNLSKYSSGRAALSETHAWLFADLLGINPAEVVAHTKIEQAKITKNKEKLKFWENQLFKINNDQSPIKIKIAQINPTVGDLKNNTLQIISASFDAANEGYDLIIFPELALTGYPPEDLLLRPEFHSEINSCIQEISDKVGFTINLIFGAPEYSNNLIYNSAYLLQDGIYKTYRKQILPNNGVFDEKRYFSSGDSPFLFDCKGHRYSILICEDIWHDNMLDQVANFGAQNVIVINASPYHLGKHQERINVLRNSVLRNNINLIYVNLVGGQDELVFDGGSFVMNNKGELTLQMPFFEESIQDFSSHDSAPNNIEIENVYKALVLSIKDYVNKNGVFDGAILGLSGGIDSALTLVLAADALGNENITAVMMPFTYTSSESIRDAREQVNLMDINYQEIEINPIYDQMIHQLNPFFNNLPQDTTEENIQSRIRGNLLMATSNKLGKILLATGNKSEMAVGYATLYGDMCGGFAPLKDIPKTMVYELANYRNSIGHVIPQNVIDRAPSAELSPDQIDEDSLPPYSILDQILERFIELRQSSQEIVELGFDSEIVKRITKLVLNNEFKRRQSAPGPKISKNAFGKERRYPITSGFYSS